MKNLPTLILASGSPRRAELLRRLALPFEARPADINEESLRHLEPSQMAQELAVQKAQAVWQPGQWVLAADTVVALEGQTLGKPHNPQENRRFLEQLSGRRHTVYTGFAILKPDGAVHREVALAQVTFRPLQAWELEWYVQSGEGLDKAGGYGAQGLGMVLLERIEGDFYTVMGLPVSRVWQRLYELGYFGLEPHRPDPKEL
ncbi:Maf family protein [Meiothermus taiwanensis]|jgi:septum formation protein|uniref:dTTP/UTP pyrophosphatase n=2 Tax=Meiothermus taiwanensis TaxID=172827 RepID=A0A399EBW5_9DEIN|nr:Maf family protein [Meiothermus taiwanensis]AWR87399.1 maf protein [Meiothermus taiwanensis WR-220]KIQ55961.1 septum formation protein Maf [Meiothermus taiwanensis]KZK15739.1 septum formation protein Maf [Meiothermus taiwanensis]RIH79622.1 Septum formation protein Maf [Meiothermus taiwanensis]